MLRLDFKSDSLNVL